MDYFNCTSIVDTSGDVEELYAYSAFGVRRIMTPTFGERTSLSFDWDFNFQGQFLDDETDYYNYGFRYYAPYIGAWPNRDPIMEEGGLNLYGFVGNAPTMRIDRLGLDPPGLNWSFGDPALLDPAPQPSDEFTSPVDYGGFEKTRKPGASEQDLNCLGVACGRGEAMGMGETETIDDAMAGYPEISCAKCCEPGTYMVLKIAKVLAYQLFHACSILMNESIRVT